MRMHSFILSLLFSSNFCAAGEIAITFDDSPRSDTVLLSGEKRTESLISSLKVAGVDEAIFFSVARNVNPNNIARLHQYVNAGHVIANHSFSHQSANRIPAEDFIADASRAHDLLSAMDGFVPLFRFPYLHRGNTIEDRVAISKGLKDLGYSDGYVTVDNYDWFMDSLLQEALKSGKQVDYQKLEKLYVEVLWQCIEYYDNLAKEVLGRSPKHVLLLHENDLAALYIDELVAHLNEKGWTIIPATSAYDDEISKFATEQFLSNQGRIAAMAQAKEMSPMQLRHPSEDETFLRNLFEREDVFE